MFSSGESALGTAGKFNEFRDASMISTQSGQKWFKPSREGQTDVINNTHHV